MTKVSVSAETYSPEHTPSAEACKILLLLLGHGILSYIVIPLRTMPDCQFWLG